MEDSLFIIFTMDVEPVTSDPAKSGPASLKEGLHSIEEYRNVLNEYGLKPTYLVHPEVLTESPVVFKKLHDEGCTVGLHLHTTKFSADRQPCELGGLTGRRQREIIGCAADMFASVMGFHPAVFRPGCYSANDATFPVLAELGFSGGSVSIPGRIWPDRFCVWSGAYPYTHFAHEAFRLSRGNLPFINIPLSVDLTAPLNSHPAGFLHYPDLRPGGVYAPADEIKMDRRSTLHNILAKMAEDNPRVKTLQLVVHNDRRFTGECAAAKNLRAVIEGIAPECETLGWKSVSGSFKDIIKIARETETASRYRRPHTLP